VKVRLEPKKEKKGPATDKEGKSIKTLEKMSPSRMKGSPDDDSDKFAGGIEGKSASIQEEKGNR